MNKLNRIDVLYKNKLVGRLALTKEGLSAFEYSPEWLKSGFSISPFELPLRSDLFIARPEPFQGGFGVFDDCLPDGWGQLVLDRHLRLNGINLRNLSLLDKLSIVGDTGRGALEFRPSKSIALTQDDIDLNHLAQEAKKILEAKDYSGKAIEEFFRRGGSPGGARPKVFIHFEGKEYMVKFRAYQDSINVGIDEYNYSLLAKKCQVEMPETRLFEGKYFGTKRFDRSPCGKIHVVSLAGLIGADYRLPSIDYTSIFQVTALLTHNMAEMWKVYRLMVFNFLIGNKDDHAKNFSFIYSDGDWHLSPAYDLLPSDGINGYHTTSFDDSISPRKEDVIKVAIKSGLDQHKATQIFDDMNSCIKNNLY